MSSIILLSDGQTLKSLKTPWIGVDLDGTLAQYSGFKGPEHIGDPIPEMVTRIKQWLTEGKTVKIFTARACVQEHIVYVEDWVEKHIGVKLEVTNIKDYSMIQLWDDRAVRVKFNEGQPCCDHHYDQRKSSSAQYK